MLNLIQHLAADPESSSGWRSPRHQWAVTRRGRRRHGRRGVHRPCLACAMSL